MQKRLISRRRLSKLWKACKTLKKRSPMSTATTLPRIPIKRASALDLSVAVHMHQSVNRPTHHGLIALHAWPTAISWKYQQPDGSVRCYLMQDWERRKFFSQISIVVLMNTGKLCVMHSLSSWNQVDSSCCPNSRNLECCAPSALQSPRATQERVGRSKVYIRPIQKDLDVTPIDVECSATNTVRNIFKAMVQSKHSFVQGSKV